MRILSVRLGHATNSSSSHSLIFLAGQQDAGEEVGRYGWGAFTLASQDARMRYLAATLHGNLFRVLGDFRTARVVVAALFGQVPVDREGDDWYVDHESEWKLPRSWGGRTVDLEFVFAMREYVGQDHFVILGGHNNEGMHPLCGEGSFRMPDAPGGSTVCRRDGNVWTLFSRETGAKVRLDLSVRGAEPSVAAAWRPPRPELIDIKITDHCTAGCPYCYQSSSPLGKHAVKSRIGMLAYDLGRANVFEVAIGGGEPMNHPDIIQILQAFRRNGVVPNVTTRRTDWLRDDVIRHAVFDAVGAVGFSVDLYDGARRVCTAMAHHGVPTGKYTLHAVEHVAREVAKIGKLCAREDVSLLLLGFKETGRGRQFDRSWGRVADVLRALKNTGVRLSVDTVFARKHRALLDDLRVPHVLYDVRDGITSAYIDATSDVWRVGPSSYEPEKLAECDLLATPIHKWPWQNTEEAKS